MPASQPQGPPARIVACSAAEQTKGMLRASHAPNPPSCASVSEASLKYSRDAVPIHLTRPSPSERHLDVVRLFEHSHGRGQDGHYWSSQRSLARFRIATTRELLHRDAPTELAWRVQLPCRCAYIFVNSAPNRKICAE